MTLDLSMKVKDIQTRPNGDTLHTGIGVKLLCENAHYLLKPANAQVSIFGKTDSVKNVVNYYHEHVICRCFK